MAANLIELFNNTIGNELGKQVSGIVGETAERTSTAVQMGVPAILSAIVRKAGTTPDAASLINYMRENNLDGSLLANASDWLQGNIETEKLMYSGAVLSRFLFDDKLAGVVDVISTQSGVSTSSATSIIKIAAPFMMNVLAKYNQEKGLDAAGLQTLLSSQSSMLKGLLPKEMNLAMGQGQSVSSPTGQAQSGSNANEPGRSKLLPWVVLAITALGLFYFVKKGCAGSTEENVAAPIAADTTAAEPEKAADQRLTFNLPDGTTLRAFPNSFTASLASFLKGSTSGAQCFTFDKVNFEDNSFKLAKGAEKQLGELAVLLKAYPDIKVQIEGHTDNEGDEGKNKNLSRERAKVIKTWLTDQGLASGRIDIKGWGEEKPVASNDSASGRAQNRRLEVCVNKK